jgi:hypothetical protein
VVNEFEDGVQGVPGCFGCLPPSSKRHEETHKVRGFPALFGHINAVQAECGPDRVLWLLQKPRKKKPQRDSVLVGDTRTERTERVGSFPGRDLIRRPVGVAGHSI